MVAGIGFFSSSFSASFLLLFIVFNHVPLHRHQRWSLLSTMLNRVKTRDIPCFILSSDATTSSQLYSPTPPRVWWATTKLDWDIDPSDPNSFGAQHVFDSMTSASWMKLFIHRGLLSSKTRPWNLHWTHVPSPHYDSPPQLVLSKFYIRHFSLISLMRPPVIPCVKDEYSILDMHEKSCFQGLSIEKWKLNQQLFQVLYKDWALSKIHLQ